MNEKLQQALAEYMSTLLDAMKSGAAYAKDQVPLVVMEKLHFDFAMAVTWVSIGALLASVPWVIRRGILSSKRFAELKQVTSYGLDQQDVRFTWLIISCFATGCGIVIVLINLYTAMEIYLAPRLYVIEWVSSLVKGK